MNSHSAMCSEPRLDYVMCASPAGTHRMAYWEWGDPDNHNILLCVHGLTRSGRDFDALAQALSSHYRVVCPDVVGRGASDWLLDPTYYAIPQYVADMLTLIARLKPTTLDWVGTSMGGLIGMGLAGSVAVSAQLRLSHPLSLPVLQQIPLGKLVLNDVGPALSWEGLQRIGDYVGIPVQFASFAEAVAYVRQTLAGFGPHTDAEWEDMTRIAFVRTAEGPWIKHYDLRIALPFTTQTEAAMQVAEQTLWQSYQSWPHQVLIMRGQQSDLLGASTVQEMVTRHPAAHSVEVAGVGHAPTLRHADQIAIVEQFLMG